MSYLRLDKINKSFEKRDVLKDVSLDIEEKTFCVFLGPSGSGKSTLLNIIAGLEEPGGGRVLLKGRDITALPPHRRDMAMVFQDYALYPHLSAFENMAFGLRARKMKEEVVKRKVEEVSRMLNIGDKLKKYPRQLSGGERQRVATGRAIVREPSLFLFDEPLSNLDARLRLDLRKEFLELHRRLKKISLYVTHDQLEALSLGDMIVVLREGAIQQISPPQELYNNPRNLFVAEFIGTPPMNILELDIRKESGKLRLSKGGLSLPAPEKLGAALRDRSDKSVYLGIRPSAVVLGPDAGKGGHSLQAEVRLTELLGEDTLIYARLPGGMEIRIASSLKPEKREGGKIDTSFPPEKMYFFNKEGRRLI